jgi:hypothetical protein
VALKSTGPTAADCKTSTHGSRSRRKLERVKGTEVCLSMWAMFRQYVYTIKTFVIVNFELYVINIGSGQGWNVCLEREVHIDFRIR